MSMFRKIDEVLQEIWSCFTCFGAIEKQNLDCQKGIHEFLSYAVFQKQSYIGPYNASSYQRVHLPPLFFSTMEISSSVSDTLKGILKDLETYGGKVSLDDLGDLKRKVMDLECQTHLQVKMLNPANRSIPYTVFVAELPQDGLVTQNQHLQKVKITYNACALKVPFNSEGQFSMDVANEINEELQAHYNEGIQVAYLVDEEIGLTLITPKDLCPRGKASEVTHQGMMNAVKKRNKY